MAIEQDIEAIRTGIREGRFPNEASVSQGIVLRVLNALDWPTYDTACVWPEYTLEGRRVDFALCHPPSKPVAFVEVKPVGQSSGSERQLFEYAFHRGVQLAILTDGREWDFFLPAERGSYSERRVYKLDIAERDLAECANRLRRYLLHSAIASGSAIDAARQDYRNIERDRQMLEALPQAWFQIIADEDEMLLEIVADRVEILCGFKPSPDMVAKFLKGSIGTTRPTASAGSPPAPASSPPKSAPPRVALDTRELPSSGSAQHRIGFDFDGYFHSASSAIDVLKQVFELFIEKDATFPERFAGLPRHGRTRRYLAREARELYPGRPDLVQECSVKLKSGWWMGTNHSRHTIGCIIQMACEVYGKQVSAHLGGD